MQNISIHEITTNLEAAIFQICKSKKAKDYNCQIKLNNNQFEVYIWLDWRGGNKFYSYCSDGILRQLEKWLDNLKQSSGYNYVLTKKDRWKDEERL